MLLLGGVLRDTSLHQLPYQGGRQGIGRLKTNGALAGVVTLEFVLVRFHRGAAHRVEGAVICGRTKRDKRFPVETEGGKLVADALFRSWGRSPDGLPQLLERHSLV